MEVSAPVSAFVPRKDRQRWDRKERRENNVLPTYRTIETPVIEKPVVPAPPPPKKLSTAKDLDDMDNVEDFFDSDTEYPEANKTATFILPEYQTISSVLPKTPASKQDNEQVYHRTPKFTTPGAKTPLNRSNKSAAPSASPFQAPVADSFTPMQTKQRLSTISQSTPGTDNTGSFSVSSDFNFPLPPIPDTPANQRGSKYSDINLKTPPFSPPTRSRKVEDIADEIDLQSVALSLAPAYPAPPAPASSKKQRKKFVQAKEIPEFTGEIVLEAPLSTLDTRRSVSCTSMFADDEASGDTFESSLDTCQTPHNLTPAPTESAKATNLKERLTPAPVPASPTDEGSVTPTYTSPSIINSPLSPIQNTPQVQHLRKKKEKSSTSKHVEPVRKKKAKKVRKQSSNTQDKENVRENTMTSMFASSVASPFSATLIETSTASQSPLNLAMTDSFLSFNSDSEISQSENETTPQRKPKTKKISKHRTPIESPAVATFYDDDEDEDEDEEQNSIASMDVSMHEDFEIAKGFHLSELDNVKIGKIKKIMKHYELPVYGRKAEMIQRLRKHFQDAKAGRKRVDSLAPSPSPRGRKRNSMIDDDDDDDVVGSKRTRITRTKPLAYWNNERVQYSRKRRQSGDFATVVDLIRQPDAPDCLPPSKRRKYREEEFPAIPVYSTAQDKDVDFHAVKNGSMLRWRALTEQEESVSSDLTTISDEPERHGHPVHHGFAFNNDFFATGQIEVAPKQSTPLQNTRGSHEFFYVVSGTAEVLINKDTFIMKRGCHFYVPPMNDYYIKNPNSSSYLSVVFFRSTEYDDEESSAVST